MLFEVIVAGVKAQLDVDDATAGGLVNEVHKSIVASAQWQEAVESLATTVAGQAAYALPANVADVLGLYIDSGSGPAHYSRIGTTDLWELKGGRRSLVGSGGVFAPQFTSAGVAQLELYPAPTQTGLAITGLVALIPADLVNGQSPVIPEDFHGDLQDGASALGLLRVENRPDIAAAFQQKADAMAERLRRRKNSRVGGPTQRIGIWKTDWV